MNRYSLANATKIMKVIVLVVEFYRTIGD